MTSGEAKADGGVTGYKEAIVIGAGITGTYQLYRLVKAGIDVTMLEAGSGAGGVWFWNRYPGCRFDSESYTYGYFFSDELFDEWEWSEHYAGQPEIERYINHVIDRFELRSHIRFDSRVARIRYDQATGEWETVTETNKVYRSKYVVTALGILSDPLYPAIPDREVYQGEAFHTARWPRGGVDLVGKRVAVIGSAASAVQAIPLIAKEAAQLTVFQRTPNWCAPLNNRPVTDQEKLALKGARQKLYNDLQDNYGGFIHRPVKKSVFDVTEAERNIHFEYLYRSSGLTNFLCNYQDIGTNLDANAIFSAFYAEKIRARIDDPVLAEKLIPKDHGFGVKRPPMETGYFEAYNRSNVELVELKKEPITRFTPTGLETTERSFDFDIVIFATGFDALTGAWNRVEITGREDRVLKEEWADGPAAAFGIMCPGFPNFFIAGGPHGAHGNVFRSTQHQVDWIADLMIHMEENGTVAAEATTEAALDWRDHVQQMAQHSLAYLADNYASGANVPGKKRTYLLYHPPSVGAFRDRMKAEADAGYPSIILTEQDGAGAATRAQRAG